MERIAERLKDRPDFRFLELESRVRRRHSDAFALMVEALKGNKSVLYLYLGGDFFNSLRRRQRRSLLAVIGGLPALEALYIANTTLSMNAVNDIGNMLLNNNGHLQEVSLQHMHIPDGVVLDPIMRALSTMSALEKVEIGILFMDSSNEAAASVESMIELCQSSTLESISLIDLRLGQQHISEMAIELSTNDTLEELHLWGEYLGFDCWIALAVMLQLNTRLRSLRLYFGTMDSDGVIAIAEALCRNKVLQSLSIENEDASVERKGVVALGQMLGLNERLESFSLATKALDDSGCTAISRELGKNASLKHLSLDNVLNRDDTTNSLCVKKEDECIVGRDGFLALSSMLRYNTCIERLDISGLSLSGSSLVKLSQALHDNHSLREMVLGEVHSGEENAQKDTEDSCAYQALIAMLEENRTIFRIVSEKDDTAEHSESIRFFLALNELGLRTLMVDVNCTMQHFLGIISEQNDLNFIHYMLSMNPSIVSGSGKANTARSSKHCAMGGSTPVLRR